MQEHIELYRELITGPAARQPARQCGHGARLGPHLGAQLAEEPQLCNRGLLFQRILDALA